MGYTISPVAKLTSMFRRKRNPLLYKAGKPAGQKRADSGSKLELEFAQFSDCGLVRKHNEDYAGYILPATPAQARSQGWLFALADGVGGQHRGEVASRMAVESVLAGFRKTANQEPHSELLTQLIRDANCQVYEAGAANGPGRGAMATTLVACALRFDQAVIGHVGDSRCYLIRQGQAQLITRDHTVANEHVRLGLLSSREAAEARTRQVLSRSLGNDLFVSVDTNLIRVLPGDLLLLCSDGLHAAVPDAEMARIVSQTNDLDSSARQLVAVANQRDGSDNVTAQLIRVLDVERIGMYRGQPYKLR
jgi:serine/threonine protein phosphatase PrpC